MAERVEHPAVAAGALAVGRCGATAPAISAPFNLQVLCALPAGHAGWHRSDGGTEWGVATADPYDTLLAREYERGVAAGRRLAADAIRSHGIRDEDLPPGRRILLDRDHAAKIAQGDTDG